MICKGYDHAKKSFWTKLAFALSSAVIFGGLHVITGWDTYVFLQTGSIGFAFAVIYLQSGNILLQMLLHFVYDVIANLTGFVEWNQSALFTSLNSIFEVMLVVMFVLSAALLLRKEH